MANIEDQTIINFADKVIRPYADRRVGLKATEDIEISVWFGSMSALLAPYADGDVILAANDKSGRPAMTKAAMTAVVVQMLADQTAVNAPGVMDVFTAVKVNVVMP